MIEVSELHKSYSDGDRHIRVLSDVSVKVGSGQSLALTGPSGSGKSTLLNILAGLLVADSGEVVLTTPVEAYAMQSLDEVARTKVRRAHIGYVHQFFNLIPTLTVLENIWLPAQLNGQLELIAQARALLERFGLANRADRFPDVLSGGEQQRVAVARALLIQPAIVLADEPTGNLDAENSATVADLLFATTREVGASLIVATHSEAVAARADKQLRLSGAHNQNVAPG